MKTIKILFASFILSTSTMVAQDSNAQNFQSQQPIGHVIRANVFDIAAGAISLGYENVMSQKSSLDVEIMYIGSSIQNRKYYRDNNLSANYVSLNTGYKYYLKRKENRPQGWYLRGGLITDYGNVKNTKGNEKKGNFYALGGDFKTGYQLILPKFLKGFTADFSLGAEYRRFFIKNLPASDSNVILPTLDISIGYSF